MLSIGKLAEAGGIGVENVCCRVSELSEYAVPIGTGLNADRPPLRALVKCATTWHGGYSIPAAVQSDIITAMLARYLRRVSALSRS